ncbi:lipid phosphate phosphatase 2-like isoform X1 [Malus sylvestris]|uniref:lipid phosphate phosphatase 2-like isoform X1 n=1 Tax=Malus sylvestris TaxID=3752 RepID=UPI0021AD01C3|nr:lipid phosphate phosphatase 2-like isoform X1 [Malus sylvestris]
MREPEAWGAYFLLHSSLSTLTPFRKIILNWFRTPVGKKMPEMQLGSHTLRSHGVKVAKLLHKYDWLILLLLAAVDVTLNLIEPFHRFVGKEMMTDLKYPFQKDTIPFWAVPIYAVLLPVAIFLVYYICRKDVYDLHHAILGLFYSVLITLVITDAIKDAVGRPRPNFFWRCFPNGIGIYDPATNNCVCTGEKKIIKEGHKSFPSGHTSVSFAGLGFLAWYLSGKIKVFDRRGHSAKLCIVILPLLCAALVGISHVDDYWHHWQDVFAGGLIDDNPSFGTFNLFKRRNCHSFDFLLAVLPSPKPAGWCVSYLMVGTSCVFPHAGCREECWRVRVSGHEGQLSSDAKNRYRESRLQSPRFESASPLITGRREKILS